MKSGDLDRRIAIERATVTVNGYNEEVRSWTILATVWAAVWPIADGERWRAGEVGATVTHRFRIRWSSTVSDITPADRISFDGRIFEISGSKEIGRREGIEITASARAE